jgi:hypothetical protein
MKFGVVIGLVGSILGTATVAGASYLSVELLRAGSFEKRMAGFEKFKDALDFEIEWKKSVGEAFSPNFALEQVSIISDERRIEVEKVEFRKFDWERPHQPRFSSIVFTGMKFKGDVFQPIFGPEMAKVLEEEKLADVMVDAVFAHESTDEEVEDPKTKRKVKQKKVSITEMKMTFRDLGTFTITMELKDFQIVAKAVARKVTQMPPLVRLLGEGVLFAGMKVVYEDKGLMRAFIDAKARELGKGELQARGSLVRELQKDAQATRSSVGSNRFDDAYFKPMITYIERYDRLTGFTLTATPPAPIELRRLAAMWEANRGGFFDKFNPKVTVGSARAAPAKKPEKPADKPADKPKPGERPR